MKNQYARLISNYKVIADCILDDYNCFYEFCFVCEAKKIVIRLIDVVDINHLIYSMIDRMPQEKMYNKVIHLSVQNSRCLLRLRPLN